MASEAGRPGLTPGTSTNKYVIMTGTELAIKLGYTVSKEGCVYNQNKLINTSIKKDKNKVVFTFVHENKRYCAYVGKLQAYQKFGQFALIDDTYYLDGNGINCEYDNISLRKIELEKIRNSSTKICSKCGKELPITDFVFKDKKNNIRSPRCKTCDNADKRNSYRKHYETNKEKFEERRIKFEKERKEFILNIKKQGCICCGESDPACIDFHHLRDKEFNIAEKANYLSEENLMKEINKCVRLCSNCHRKLHYYNYNLEELKQHVSVPSAA